MTAADAVRGNRRIADVKQPTSGVDPTAGAVATVPWEITVRAVAADCSVVGDGAVGYGYGTGGGVEGTAATFVAILLEAAIASPRPVVLHDHVVQRDLAAAVEDPAAQGIGGPGLRTVRPIVLGEAALDDQVLEDNLRARVHDLKDPVLELAGVNDRGVVPGRAGALDDPAVAGLVQVQVAGEARRLVTVANVLDGQSVRARP